MQSKVLFELSVHNIGREQQGTLAELRELLCLAGRIRLRRRVDDDDFIRPVDEILGDRVDVFLADHAPDELALLGDVLEID